MSITVYSAALWGIDAYPVHIEVDLSNGLPQILLVGLPDQAVKEAKERVRTAIKNSGYALPSRKIVVNLAPADIKKEGPAFDLAIAIGILACLEHVPAPKLEDYCFLGELALSGRLRKTQGALPATLLLKNSGKTLVVPPQCETEICPIKGVEVLVATSLLETVQHLREETQLRKAAAQPRTSHAKSTTLDFAHVKGQALAKRAIEVAVSGGHNLIMTGPPGGGKSMLARRIPSILPQLNLEESLEISKVRSAAGLMENASPLTMERPFRAPHHTVSPAGLAGGGSFPKPGEISLAHHGVLFLDELPEFRKDSLECLRAPMEDGELFIGRAKATLKFPARFMLVAAMNPCRCGHLGDAQKPCHCTLPQIISYRNRISGPLLDRIDIHLEVHPVSFTDLTRVSKEESSAVIRERIDRVRARQATRLKQTTHAVNAGISGQDLKRYCSLEASSQKLLAAAMQDLHLSARAYTRVLRVSRTIADIAESETIQAEHVAEAIQYRSLDRPLLC